jgi:hypothetical protein
MPLTFRDKLSEILKMKALQSVETYLPNDTAERLNRLKSSCTDVSGKLPLRAGMFKASITLSMEANGTVEAKIPSTILGRVTS